MANAIGMFDDATRGPGGAIDELLTAAANFAEAGDFTAAVERAHEALRAAPGDDARDEARVVLERLEAAERSWLAAAEARGAAYVAREDAELDTPVDGGVIPRRRSSPSTGRRPRRPR